VADDRIEIELIIDEDGPLQAILDITGAVVDSADDMSEAITRNLSDAFEQVNVEVRESARTFRERFTDSARRAFRRLSTDGLRTARELGRNFTRQLARAFNPRNLLRSFNQIRRQVFTLRNAFVGAFAAIGAGALISQVTQLASAQQDAINQLNSALATAGTFSEQASQNFQDLASSLQRTSRFGDEVILQQAALARNFTRTNEEAERLVTVALDVSEATGITLDSAVRNLGRTLGGLTGELGEAVPIIRTLTQEQLRAGEAINLLSRRFGGAALAATRTFSGALAQLRNNFSDFLESIGQGISESPAVIAFFNTLSSFFANLGNDIRNSGSSFESFIRNVIDGIIVAGEITIDVFEQILTLPNRIQGTFLALRLEVLQFVESILSSIERLSGLGGGFARALGLGVGGEAIADLETIRSQISGTSGELESLANEAIQSEQAFDSLRQRLNEFQTAYGEALAEIETQGIGTAITNSTRQAAEEVPRDILELRRNIALLRVDAIEAIGEAFFNEGDEFDANESLFRDLGEASRAELQQVQQELQNLITSSQQAAMQLNQAFTQGVGNAISQGVQSAVTALQEGQNAFQAFGQAVLGVFGDLAIQLGQFFIVQGIAVEALNAISGTGAIAAGIALIALGTLLKSFSGGQGNIGGGSAVSPPLADLDPAGGGPAGPDDFQGRQTEVNVRVDGNLTDPEGAAIAIANLLREEGFQNSVLT